ncbi:unnamed protein product, partial [Brassica rapa subsp. trilocularis]
FKDDYGDWSPTPIVRRDLTTFMDLVEQQELVTLVIM